MLGNRFIIRIVTNHDARTCQGTPPLCSSLEMILWADRKLREDVFW